MLTQLRSALRGYGNLPRPVWALAGARFVNAFGAYVFPFLTLLLTEHVGLDEEATGRVLMIAMTMMVPGSLLGGVLADRIGRKRLLVASQVMAALCIGVVGFLPLNSNIIWFILAESFFSGMMTPASRAANFDLTDPENRKDAFSLLYLAHNLGFAAGPLLAGLMYEHHVHWLFLGDAATSILSVVFIIALVPETLPSADAAEEHKLSDGEKAVQGSTLGILFRRPMLLFFVVLMIVPWFVYGQQSFSLPMFAKHLYPETGALLYGKVMSLNAVIVVVLTVPLIRLTHAIRPVFNVALHSVLYGLGFGMLALFQSPAAFYAAALIWTSGEILGATNIDVYVANHTPSSHRGRFGALLPLISGTGSALSPWLTGIFLLTRPISSVWVLSFILGSLAGICFLVLGIADSAGLRHVSGENQD